LVGTEIYSAASSAKNKVFNIPTPTVSDFSMENAMYYNKVLFYLMKCKLQILPECGERMVKQVTKNNI
jgi:hypothetical protein